MLKQVGNIFGKKLFVETETEEDVKEITNWVGLLEAREARVKNKEIELNIELNYPNIR